MAAMPLPVTLKVGETICDVGSVNVPFTMQAVDRRSVSVRIDQPELRRRLAAMLREAADTLEEGAADGD